MTVIIFFLVVVVNITGFCFILRNFFRKERYTGKSSVWSTVTKIFSVIFNLVIFWSVIYAIAGGLWNISAHGHYYKLESIHLSDFFTGLILIETAIFLPYGLNLLLYKWWYKKTGLSKYWIFPAIAIGAGAFIVCVFSIISGDFINDWSTVKWRR